MTDAAALPASIHLLGCGRMGGAMLEGWLANGLPPAAVSVTDPAPSDRLRALAEAGLTLNPAAPGPAEVCLLAVKPQMMAAAIGAVAPLATQGALFVSIAAGTPIRWFEEALGPVPIIRSMPNTPAAVGRGVTALIGNARASEAHMATAEAMLSAIGETVRLEDESQMDAVTGVSGSGPAYVFHLIEALAAAAEAEGLPPELAMRLARATVCGAGELAFRTPESAEALRIAVTSPGGTTAAGLAVLMDPETGLPPLIRRTVAAAAARSRELGG